MIIDKELLKLKVTWQGFLTALLTFIVVTGGVWMKSIAEDSDQELKEKLILTIDDKTNVIKETIADHLKDPIPHTLVQQDNVATKVDIAQLQTEVAGIHTKLGNMEREANNDRQVIAVALQDLATTQRLLLKKLSL